jgi:ribonuclease BN (tRNA processing enzyme)
VAELELRFIGTGNAFAPGGLCWNGFTANGRFLFEAPPQALQALNKLGADPNALDAVVLSHHHGDHFLGLPFLLLHWKYQRRTRPVSIVGPPGTRELASRIAASVFPGIFEADYRVDWREVDAGVRVEVAGLELEALGMQHDTRLSASLGFNATLGGRRFSYTGDTAMCESVMAMARHAEVLVSECASRAERIPIHMNLVDDMPALRSAMPAAAHLVITHIGPDVRAGELANTTVAADQARYLF